jgi:ribosomal protein S14
MGKLEDAAENVLRAMRSLDAHRHDGAPSLEREYRRALESYFVMAERALGRDASRDDEVDEDLDLASRVDELRNDATSVLGHYAAARRALRLARAYRSEPETSGRRERECIRTALRHREAIRAIRLHMRPPAEQLQLPGLAKTRPNVAAPARVSKTG